MSWISNVRNAISAVVGKKETPDNLWHKCKGCGQMTFAKELEENLYVCPQCDHHDRIGPQIRFAQILDPGFTAIPLPRVPEDPLKFRDTKKYADRIEAMYRDHPAGRISRPLTLWGAAPTVHDPSQARDGGTSASATSV